MGVTVSWNVTPGAEKPRISAVEKWPLTAGAIGMGTSLTTVTPLPCPVRTSTSWVMTIHGPEPGKMSVTM